MKNVHPRRMKKEVRRKMTKAKKVSTIRKK